MDNADKIRLSRDLVTLKKDTPVECSLDEFEVRAPDAEVLMAFLGEMEFRTLAGRVATRLKVAAPVLEAGKGYEVAGAHEDGAEAEAARPFDTAGYECIRDAAALERWVARIMDVGHVAVDTETTSLDEMQAELVGISLCVDAGKAAYIPLGHKAGTGDLFGASELAAGQMGLEEALAILKPVLEDASILKIGQNMKYDWKIFARAGVRIAPFDDTMLMSYAMHGGLNTHGMDALSEKYLGHSPITHQRIAGNGQDADHL